MSKDSLLNEFQTITNDTLARNTSILDILSKLNIANAKIDRSLTKSITHCGCLNIDVSKLEYSNENSLNDLKNSNHSHISGNLCEDCLYNISNEIGEYLFYLNSLCNTIDIDISEIVLNETKKMKTLGKFLMR